MNQTHRGAAEKARRRRGEMPVGEVSAAARTPPRLLRASPRLRGELSALLILALLSGCVINKNKYPRPRDLPPSWLIDRVRILAVQADPPEATPGTQVHFTALITDPNDEVDLTVWLACPPDLSGGAGCAVDLGSLSGSPTPEELAAAGVIGIEPGLPPTYTPDESLLADLTDDQRLEGLNVTVQVAAFPSSMLEDTDFDPDAYNQVEVGYKRLVVSDAATPNHNPTIAAFTVDGVEIPPGTVAEVDHAQKFELGIVIPPEAIETYEYKDREGQVEERTEQPYATWYCTGGTVGEYWTLYPYTQANWTSPADASETPSVTCWAVVRDRRGGMAWVEQALTIR
jgi:hypothetical protein